MNIHLNHNEVFSANIDLHNVMTNRNPRTEVVIGPLGEALTLESLPPRDCNRWVPRRKAEVVAAVNGSLLTIEEACAWYNLTREEFVGWQHAFDVSGMRGLRITRATRKNLSNEKPDFSSRIGFSIVK